MTISIESFSQDIQDAIEASHLDNDILLAYASLIGAEYFDVDTAEESYSGTYDSAADFAQQMAEDTGMIADEVSWPYTCIDWEWAARELMYDYMEQDGHYFRNM